MSQRGARVAADVRDAQYAGPHRKTRRLWGGSAVPLDPWYVTGLTDGEGCFCVSLDHQSEAGCVWASRSVPRSRCR